MEQDKQQEILQKLHFYEQQLGYLDQQSRAVEEGILELNTLSLGLDEIAKCEGEEILAQVGRGIFVKAKLSSKDLIVDVGSKNLVKKDISGTKEIISKQINKLNDLKEELSDKIEEVQREATEILNETQRSEQEN